MTNWTEVNNVSTTWGEQADIATNYTETADKDTNWGFFGGLIRLCTEGYREDLMSEGRVEYLVYSHGEDVEIWTDTADIATTYTKINDI